MIRSLLLLSLVLSFSAAALSSRAQDGVPVPAIGILMISAGPNDAMIQALREGMRDRGYVEGRTFRIEYRGAHGAVDRLPQLAEELVRLRVAAIVTGTYEATIAAKHATSTIPIIAGLNPDPVNTGLIESFSRPGGNVTGLYAYGASELAGKRLELLKETLPSLARVAVICDSFSREELVQLQRAAHTLDIQLQVLELKAPYDLDGAFKAAKGRKAAAVIVLGNSPELYVSSARLGALALENSLPLIGSYRDLVAAGGLMYYGLDARDAMHQLTYFIDRVLKGAKASDLPFERSTRVKLVVNLKTAKALGLTVPESISLRADQLIQ